MTEGDAAPPQEPLDGTGRADDAPAHHVSKLPLVIMGAVIVLAVLVTIAFAAFRGPAEYDDGTPEALLQGFLQAVFDGGDPSTVLELLTPAGRAACEADTMRRPSDLFWDTGGLRAELDSMRIDGDTAVGVVTFRSSDGGGPFETDSYSFRSQYTLQRVDGEWRIDRADWPYPIEACTWRLRP